MKTIVEFVVFFGLLCVTTCAVADFASEAAAAEKIMTDATLFLATARDIIIDKKSGLIKVSAFFPPSVISDYVAHSVGPLFDLIISVGSASVDFIRLCTTDLKRIVDRFDCMSKSNEELKSQSDSICRSVGCLDRKTCAASAIRETLIVLRPFVQDFVGKVKSMKKNPDGKVFAEIERGILLSLNTLTALSLKVARDSELNLNLGAAGSDLFDKTEEMISFTGRNMDLIAVALNQMLDGLELVALVIGGPDSIPSAKKELKEFVKTHQVVLRDDF